MASFVQQNRIKLKKDKFVFQGDNGVDSYLNFISEVLISSFLSSCIRDFCMCFKCY